MAEFDAPLVSVIIPVFNDGEQLKLCLAALAQQSYPRSQIEIIVVDNSWGDREARRETESGTLPVALVGKSSVFAA
ncbi:glycosyltransferase [Leptolyngbya sp. ST-U4]|uniref:glycosyltransferase family 2 protein n=1 Tax=Leptolyngbya sp. ST-U4 TaxID=2933912 RepID=UPI00329A11B7